jgi:hypothetical protein
MQTAWPSQQPVQVVAAHRPPHPSEAPAHFPAHDGRQQAWSQQTAAVAVQSTHAVPPPPH